MLNLVGTMEIEITYWSHLVLATSLKLCWVQHGGAFEYRVGCWWHVKLNNSKNTTQQLAKTPNKMFKRSQHVGPNNVATVCTGLYRRSCE